MTDRILDTSGKYAPTHSEPSQSVEVDASTLPQVKPDAYAGVDHRDFSTAGEMSRVQVLTMANIAQSRGDAEASMRWKQVGIDQQQAEERAADVATMHKVLNPEPYVPHTGPLVQPKAVEPWAQDPAYKAAQEAVTKAQDAVEKTRDGTSQRIEANAKAQLANSALTDVVDGLKAKTRWSESEQRALDARASLAAKTEQVIEMAKRG